MRRLVLWMIFASASAAFGQMAAGEKKAEQKILAKAAKKPAGKNPSSPNHRCFKPANKLCQKIKTLSPDMNNDRAFALSNVFFRVAKRFKLPPDLLLSIAKQESDFRQIVRKLTGHVETEDGWIEQTVATDFCMMQIHSGNIKKMKLDVENLLNNDEACVVVGAKILSEAKKHQSKEPDWWTRYNASPRNKPARRQYEKDVMRYWRKLDPAGEGENPIFVPG